MYNKKIVLTLIIIIASYLVFFIISAGLVTKNLKNLYRTNVAEGSVIAPYYSQDVFFKPTDIISATSSTTTVNIKNSTQRLPIIMYHYVDLTKAADDLIKVNLTINPTLFENQLKTLRDAHYTTFFVRDIPSLLKESNNSKAKNIILTFDDGYEDFYKVALPLLKKYQIKSTIYVIDFYLNKKGYLTDAEVKELIDSGLVEIGSHTLDHPYLAKISYAQMYKEVFESKKDLEKKFSIPIQTFAYPYGSFNEKVVEQVKKAGYLAAVSVISGTRQSNDNLFYLSRIRAGVFEGKDMLNILTNNKK